MLTPLQRIVLLAALSVGLLLLVLEDIKSRVNELEPYIQAHKETTHARH